MDKVVAFVGTRSSKRAKESKNGDARRVEEASEDSKSPVSSERQSLELYLMVRMHRKRVLNCGISDLVAASRRSS